MAQMIAKPHAATPWDATLTRAGQLGRMARAFVDRIGWQLLLWRLLWAPWWLLANRPMPDLPRHVALASELDAPGLYVVRTLDRLRRKVQFAWLFACLVRGLALGVMVGIVWVLVTGVTGTARPDPRTLLIVCGALAGCGIVFAAFS